MIGVFGRERGEPGPKPRNPDGTTFVTHADSTGYLTPPFVGLVGFGVQRNLHRRLAVRVDVQALALLIIPVGVRAAAGVTIPVGAIGGVRATVVSR